MTRNIVTHVEIRLKNFRSKERSRCIDQTQREERAEVISRTLGPDSRIPYFFFAFLSRASSQSLSRSDRGKEMVKY